MLASRRRTPPQVQCEGHFHVIRTASLILRTPTQSEARIAGAGASDEQAQRWLGWSVESIYPETHRAPLLASPADGLERPAVPPLIAPGRLVALDPRLVTVAGEVAITVQSDGPHVGGWLTPRYRGRGLGRELFGAALVLGPRHLGIELLRAGAEESNTASRRSLEAAGFLAAHGDPSYRLSNGRVTSACWYEHTATASTCQAP
jgi:RimJ/RimL family protein N-acetyltransferase